MASCQGVLVERLGKILVTGNDVCEKGRTVMRIREISRLGKIEYRTLIGATDVPRIFEGPGSPTELIELRSLFNVEPAGRNPQRFQSNIANAESPQSRPRTSCLGGFIKFT
jgi:hypothetical protein